MESPLWDKGRMGSFENVNKTGHAALKNSYIILFVGDYETKNIGLIFKQCPFQRLALILMSIRLFTSAK